MPATADVGNSANWQFAISESKSATVGRIEEFAIPIQLDNQVIAVMASSNMAPDSWYAGGTVFQKVRLGILTGGQPDAIASRHRVWLNRFALLFLPKLSTSYALTYLPPYWFRNATISVWEYVGADPVTPDGDNAAILQQLTEIEQKINSLL